MSRPTAKAENVCKSCCVQGFFKLCLVILKMPFVELRFMYMSLEYIDDKKGESEENMRLKK